MQNPCSKVLLSHPEPSRDKEVKMVAQAAATRRLSEVFSAGISYLISAPFQPQYSRKMLQSHHSICLFFLLVTCYQSLQCQSWENDSLILPFVEVSKCPFFCWWACFLVSGSPLSVRQSLYRDANPIRWSLSHFFNVPALLFPLLYQLSH